MNGTLSVGTSGIVVPGAKKTFPERFRDKTRLHYYASIFNTLEINSSFYKVPMSATFAKWAVDVPACFKFTVKLWREITHAKKLDFSSDNIRYFMHSLDIKQQQKGCLLMQFPASITNEYLLRVKELIQQIKYFDPGSEWKLALEFRHKSWYNNLTYSLLDDYQASVVLHDMPASQTRVLNKNAPAVYIRFHGPLGDYRGTYSDEYLKDWSVTIKRFLKKRLDVYVYFNNTIGNAFENAQRLRSLSSEKINLA